MKQYLYRSINWLAECPMTIKAVIFDMDETLTIGFDADRNEEIDIHFLSWQAVLKDTGHTLSFSEYASNIRGATNRVSEQWLLERFGFPLEARLADTKEAWYRDHLINKYLHFRPGVDACLKGLRDSGARVGLLTSAPYENVASAHEKLNLWDRIERKLSLDVDDLAELKLQPKPAPDGLIEIQGRLGLNADELLYVGDSVGDMQAAQQANMRALGIVAGNDAPTLLKHGATATFRHFDELQPWLKTLS